MTFKQSLSLLCFILFFPQNVFAKTSPFINEFVPHANSSSIDWIEFYNPENVDLSSYYIDDDTLFDSDDGNSKKKQLLGLINNSDTQFPYVEIKLFLNNDEDYVVLFDSNGGIIDQYQYTEDPGVDIAIGRSPDGVGQWNVLSYQTKGLQNSSPLPSPTLTPSDVPTFTPSPKPTNSPSPTKTPTPIKKTSSTNSPTTKPTSTPSLSPLTQNVLAVSDRKTVTSSSSDKKFNFENDELKKKDENLKEGTNSSQIKAESTKSANKLLGNIIFIVIGGVIIVISCGILGFRYWKRNS